MGTSSTATALALALTLAACSPGKANGEHEQPVVAIPPPAPAPSEVDAAPQRPAAPDDLPARCREVCERLAKVAGEGASEAETLAAWTDRCRERCEGYASIGQLDCYDRVARPGDIDACAAR